MFSREQRFLVVVRDGNGTAVDTSHYKPDSFEAAVTIGRALQNCNGCTVIVIDKSEHSPEVQHQRKWQAVLCCRASRRGAAVFW